MGLFPVDKSEEFIEEGMKRKKTIFCEPVAPVESTTERLKFKAVEKKERAVHW